LQHPACQLDPYDLRGRSETIAPQVRQRTDAVNVGLDCIRHLEVNDQGNIGYIDTTTCQIGCDENVSFAVAKLGERSFSLFLTLPRVQSRCAPLYKNQVSDIGSIAIQ
jgi:hypothetical protein